MSRKKSGQVKLKRDPERNKRGEIAMRDAMRLLAEGITAQAVARKVKVAPTRVTLWKQSPEGRKMFLEFLRAREAELDAGVRDGRAELRNAVSVAVEALVDVAVNGSGQPRVTAAQTILDRIGIIKTEQVQLQHSGGADLGKLSPEELRQLEELTTKAMG